MNFINLIYYLPWQIDFTTNWTPILRTVTLILLSAKSFWLKIRRIGNSIYSIYEPLGERLIDRLCLSFSHLQEHKFRHDFGDAVNPLCSCTLETEHIEYFFQHCQNINTHFTLMNELNNISNVINSLNLTNFIRVILYGDKHFDNATNFKITTATISFIKTTKRFEEALLNYWFVRNMK